MIFQLATHGYDEYPYMSIRNIRIECSSGNNFIANKTVLKQRVKLQKKEDNCKIKQLYIRYRHCIVLYQIHTTVHDIIIFSAYTRFTRMQIRPNRPSWRYPPADVQILRKRVLGECAVYR